MKMTLTGLLVLAAVLCGTSDAKAQYRSKSYYYGYYFYYWDGGGYYSYPLPTDYYVYYPSYTYVDAYPIWFTPPAPRPVVNIYVTPTYTPSYTPTYTPSTTVTTTTTTTTERWETVYPIWTGLFPNGKSFRLKGDATYTLESGPAVKHLPSGYLPSELFSKRWVGNDGKRRIQYNTSVFVGP